MLKSQKVCVQAWLCLLLMMGFFCNHTPVLGPDFPTYKIGKESLSCTTLPLYGGSVWANVIKDRKASWSLLQERWLGGVWDGSEGDCSLASGMWWSREWDTFLLSRSRLSVPFPPFFPSPGLHLMATDLKLWEMGSCTSLLPLSLLSYPPATQLQWWYVMHVQVNHMPFYCLLFSPSHVLLLPVAISLTHCFLRNNNLLNYFPSYW